MNVTVYPYICQSTFRILFVASRAKRRPVFKGTVPFLREMSRFPTMIQMLLCIPVYVNLHFVFCSLQAR
jgi:hypothetical protein